MHAKRTYIQLLKKMSLYILQVISYDLGDCTKWEYMFPGLDKPILQIPDPHDDLLLDDDEEVRPSPHIPCPSQIAGFLDNKLETLILWGTKSPKLRDGGNAVHFYLKILCSFNF
jgi:hypothetical protein